MHQLTVTINGKGGVGKSLFTVHLLTYLQDREVPFYAIDTDNENSTLTRFFPKAGFVDIEDKREIDKIFISLDTNELVVVDARAASTDLFLDYFDELQIFEMLKQLDTRLTLVCPINHEPDSIEQVRFIVDKVGANASYLIVKNQSHSDNFKLWDSSKTKARVNELGGQEIVMPKIYDWLVTVLNRENVPVARALESDFLNTLDLQRLRNWQKRFEAELDNVYYLLAPTQ